MSTPRPPIVFALDAVTRIRTATYAGIVGDDDLFAAYQALLADPAYEGHAHDLVDLRAVTRLDVSSDALRRIMAMYEPVDDRGVRTRLAFVAGADAVYGMARMYELLRGDGVPEEIQVFRTMADAMEWLRSAGRPGTAPA